MDAVALSLGGWLDAPAAASFERMAAAYTAETGRPFPLTSAGRTREEQQREFDRVGPQFAAAPGTSVHEFGLAIDTDAWAWVLAHPEFGWLRPTRAPFDDALRYEPWHVEYDAARDVVLTTLNRRKKAPMYVKFKDLPAVYAVYTDATGHPRMRVCGPHEAAFATSGGLVVAGDEATTKGLATETGYPARPAAGTAPGLTDAQLDALAEKVAARLNADTSSAVADELAKRLES